MNLIKEINKLNNVKELKIEKETYTEGVLVRYVEKFAYNNKVYSRYYIATDDFVVKLKDKEHLVNKGELFIIDDDDILTKEVII